MSKRDETVELCVDCQQAIYFTGIRYRNVSDDGAHVCTKATTAPQESVLVEFFRTERPDEGWMGDEHGETPEECAIRVMRSQARQIQALRATPCNAEHPHYGWLCALPTGHAGGHAASPTGPTE